MSKIFLASKTCFLILLLVSTGSVRAGTIMSEEDREHGMKLLGSVFFPKSFRADQWKQYLDPLANYYTILAVNSLGSVANFPSNKLNEKDIEVTALPNEIGWKLSFPYFKETEKGVEHTIKELFSSNNREIIRSALEDKSGDLSRIVGFGLDWICDANTDLKGNSPTEEKEELNTGPKVILKGHSPKGTASMGVCRLCVVVTTRRSKADKIYPSEHDDLMDSVANFATRCANKASIGQMCDPNSMEDRKKFVIKRKVSAEEIQSLRTHMKSATANIVAKTQSKQANVIIAGANVFVWNLREAKPTEDYVVVLGFEGLSEDNVLNLTSQLSFKEHNFQPYQPDHSTGDFCDVCQKSSIDSHEQSNLRLECTECGLVVHGICRRKTPKIFGLALDAVGKINVPFILRNMIPLIEKHGVTTEGIYRLGGSVPVVNNLKSDFNSGMCISKDRLEKYAEKSVSELCALVKQFLMELNPRLISFDVFKEINASWKDAGPSISEAKAVANNVLLLNRCFNDLPPSHKITLKFILQHLHTLSRNSEVNKMHAANLSTVFAINITDLGTQSEELEHTPRNH